MPKMFIVRGLPGSGKTTMAESLLAHEAEMDDGCDDDPADRVFEADKYFVDKTGVYSFDATRLSEAHADCLKKAIQCMARGEDLAVANTFSRGWEMEPYLREAERYGYDVVVLTMQNDYGNVHNVPPEAVEAMSHRWEHNPPCLAELHERQQAQGEEHRLFARSREGRLAAWRLQKGE